MEFRHPEALFSNLLWAHEHNSSVEYVMILVLILSSTLIVAEWGLEARLGSLSLPSVGADRLVGFEMEHSLHERGDPAAC